MSGFKAASLRDIASDAGVSLTLVHHHFGSKEQLLLAVVAIHHESCRQRMAGLRYALRHVPQPPSVAEVATAWVRHEFELYDSDAGQDYLLFLMKMLNDQHVESGIREMLDCSAPVVVNALALAAPGAGAVARGRSFVLARGALHAAIVDCAIAMEAGLDDQVAAAVTLATEFVAAGLSASCGPDVRSHPERCSR